MTSPDMDDEAMKAMARRICANACGIGKIGRACAADFLSGRADDGTDMAIALAAIIETRDCDAALAETLFDKGGCHAMYKNAGHQAAAAIRSGQHYGKDRPHA